MITEKLELLALQDKAVWNVANFAAFDNATLKVPNNGFILLRQIIWNHFCDAIGTETTPGDVIAKSIHGLSISELGSTHELYYNFRSSVRAVAKGDGTFFAELSGNPITIVETFKIFVKDIILDISRIQDMNAFAAVATGKMEANSEERNVPVGFGVGAAGIDVTAFVTFPAPDGGLYYPNGDKRKILGVASPLSSGARYRDQFRNPVNASTRLNKAIANTSNGRQNMLPLVSLGYWKVNGSPADLAKM